MEELFDAEGARSPAQRDSVRKRVGVGLYETTQALIVYAKYAALYSLFLVRYPAHAIAFSTFKRLRPWYVRRAKEESCLCKQCDNFKQQQVTFRSVLDLIKPVLMSSPTADAEDAPDNDMEANEASTWSGQAELEKLAQFCRLESKSEMMKFVLCDGAMDGEGKQACIDGACEHCGFRRIWSEGLRPHVVDESGNIRSSAPLLFQSVVEWVRIRSSKQATPEEGKNTCYESRKGTVVQLLNEFESETARKFPHHRFTIGRQRAADDEFNRNRWPGWLSFAVDFAMDGTIPPPQGRSMQSDHWSPMSYTLFVNVVSWLRSDKWKSRESRLNKGDAVTVEPSAESRLGATEPAPGSYWAEIVSLPVTDDGPFDPESQVYGVRRHDAAADMPLEMVERRFLRQRVLYTQAFVHVSDDKQHDSHAAQLFISKTLEHLEQNYLHTGKEAFVALRLHSDNAPSHFKSSKTMHFLTRLPEHLKAWCSAANHSFRVVWEFGAPGHGKGVWDGIGAWMKRTVRQDIVDHTQSMPTVLTSDGHILSPKQVHEHLQASSVIPVLIDASCACLEDHCG